MISALLVATLLTIAAASTLRLNGDGTNAIVFGPNLATAATLSASCGSAEQPTITCLSPRQFESHEQNMSVQVLLGNVAPSCLAISTRRIPCAIIETDREDPFAGDPLFYCKFIGQSESTVTGPVYANATAIDARDPALGYRITATCPVPSYNDLLRLGPYDGNQDRYDLNVSMMYWAATESEFAFEGAPGGQIITFWRLPAPPPPSPPYPPPFSPSSVYVHYGATTCESGSTTLYSGFVAGAHYTTVGSTSSYICMHPEPQSLGTSVASSADLYGTEYQQSLNINGDAACAVCQRTDAGHAYTQWGRSTSCSNGHTALYTGTAMTAADSHYRTEAVCVDSRHVVHSASSTTDDNGALFYELEMQGNAANEAQYPAGTDIGCSVCGSPPQSGAIYVHYGATTCESGSTTLYSGFVAGAHYTTVGSTSSYICMHPEPQSLGTSVASSADLYGTEYQQSLNINGDAACAVCQRTDAGHAYTQWGRSTSCSNGHTALYTGTAMTAADSHYRTEAVCVDSRHVVHSASSTTDDNGALFYELEMQGNAANEAQYPAGTDIGCSVCAVPALL